MPDAITGPAIFAALLADEKFKGQESEAAAQLETLRADVEALPAILADQLDQPVTFSGLIAAKITFMTYVLNEGSLKGVTAASVAGGLFDAMFGEEEDSEASLQGAMVSLMTGVLEALKDINVEAILHAQDLTDEQALLGDKVGLLPELRALHEAGRFTFADLLRVQPKLIVLND